jgi:hypothetical protein
VSSTPLKRVFGAERIIPAVLRDFPDVLTVNAIIVRSRKQKPGLAVDVLLAE